MRLLLCVPSKSRQFIANGLLVLYVMMLSVTGIRCTVVRGVVIRTIHRHRRHV